MRRGERRLDGDSCSGLGFRCVAEETRLRRGVNVAREGQSGHFLSRCWCGCLGLRQLTYGSSEFLPYLPPPTTTTMEREEEKGNGYEGLRRVTESW